MQTFVPELSFKACAQALDTKRLGKQRVECKQILAALTGAKGWSHGPAVRMWEGHRHALMAYSDAICDEWFDRGFDNYGIGWFGLSESDIEYPTWWGGPIHASHRAVLLHKRYAYYRHLGWSESPRLDYYWPVS